MKDSIIRLFKSRFIRNVMILSSGTLSAQIIVFILTPIITRLYGPETYGLMGSFNAIISIVTPVAALTLPAAIVLPKRDDEALEIIKLSLYIVTIITIIVTLCILLFQESIVYIFQLEGIDSYLIFIPIAIFLTGFLQIIEQWLIRNKQFLISAKSKVIQSIIINGGKVGFGFFHPSALVLIAFSAISNGLNAFLLNLFSRKTKYKLPIYIFKSKIHIKRIIKQYKDFPLYRAPQTLIDSITRGLPVLMLASFFGPASVGFYNIGRSVLNVPTLLIGKSVGDVFYPKITNVANNNQSVTKVLIKATILLSVLGSLPFCIIVFFGPQLFGLIFGSDWMIAGEYARWIALWSFTTFIIQPTLKVIPVLSVQRFHLIFTIGSLFIRLFLLSIGYFIFSNDIISIALFGATSGILNIILILIIVVKSKRFDASRTIIPNKVYHI